MAYTENYIDNPIYNHKNTPTYIYCIILFDFWQFCFQILFIYPKNIHNNYEVLNLKTGMVRRIDELGRIVIPKEIRKNLKLNMGDIVEIYVEDNKVMLKRFSTLLGLEEDLFNIAKVINELSQATVLFVEHDKIIVSYGKRSELFLDKDINKHLYNKANNQAFTKLKSVYIISEVMEERTTYIAPLYMKNNVQGLFIIIENEHIINQYDLEIINQFKKFIIKQLDS